MSSAGGRSSVQAARCEAGPQMALGVGNCGVCHTMAVSGHTTPGPWHTQQQRRGAGACGKGSAKGCRRKRVLKQRITKCTFPPPGPACTPAQALQARQPLGGLKPGREGWFPACCVPCPRAFVTGLASSRARTRHSDSTRRRSDPQPCRVWAD